MYSALIAALTAINLQPYKIHVILRLFFIIVNHLCKDEVKTTLQLSYFLHDIQPRLHHLLQWTKDRLSVRQLANNMQMLLQEQNY